MCVLDHIGLAYTMFFQELVLKDQDSKIIDFFECAFYGLIVPWDKWPRRLKEKAIKSTSLQVLSIKAKSL